MPAVLFSSVFSTQESPEVQMSWERQQEITDLSWNTPAAPFLAVSHSSRQHRSPGLGGDVPSQGSLQLLEVLPQRGLRVTPASAHFRSLNFLTSTHNISQKNHYVSELFSHTRISLNHLYLKERKKCKSGSL